MTFHWWHVIIWLLPMAPTFWSILDIWTHSFEDSQTKMLWLVITIFVPVFGGLAYIFWGRKKAGKRIGRSI